MLSREEIIEILKVNPEKEFVAVTSNGSRMEALYCKEYNIIMCCHTPGTVFVGYELV